MQVSPALGMLSLPSFPSTFSDFSRSQAWQRPGNAEGVGAQNTERSKDHALQSCGAEGSHCRMQPLGAGDSPHLTHQPP